MLTRIKNTTMTTMLQTLFQNIRWQIYSHNSLIVYTCTVHVFVCVLCVGTVSCSDFRFYDVASHFSNFTVPISGRYYDLWFQFFISFFVLLRWNDFIIYYPETKGSKPVKYEDRFINDIRVFYIPGMSLQPDELFHRYENNVLVI